jgi:thioesterase domain-containing protein/NAD(P)-dependent dehydrogenase (short-subunit alcohol dehydrogenase family)/acyl carrier protein
VFVEVGPGRTLTTLVTAQRTKVRHAVNSVRHPKEAADDVEYALLTLGKAWAGGADVDWTALYDGQLRNRVPLPGYPFEGQSYWLAPKALAHDAGDEPVKRPSLDDWFATVAWVPTPRVPAAAGVEPAQRWLLVGGDGVLARGLADALRRAGGPELEIVVASHGARLRPRGDGAFELEAGAGEQYRELLERRKAAGAAPQHVVLLPDRTSPPAAATAGAEPAFLVPTRLLQIVAATLDAAAVTFVSHNAFAIGAEPLCPDARLAVGPALVGPRELPDFPTRLVDLDGSGGEAVAAQAEGLARELLGSGREPLVALRAGRRFTPQLRPVPMPAVPPAPDWLVDGDVVFVTGGLGGIGRVLAAHLAGQRRVKLALLSRDRLPPREQHDALLQRTDVPERTKVRLRWLRALEQKGAEVMVVTGDVTERESLRAALDEVRRRFGPLRVVVHTAGVMQDEPLLAKAEATMLRVLAPKVAGTRHLDALVTEELRAFVLMSSVASNLGLPGQVDYTAANAFLDAYAEQRQRTRPGRTVVIDWNAWRDVGMVVDGSAPPADGAGGAALPPLPAAGAHPWLAAELPLAGGRRYATDFAVATHWLLAEHRIEGGAALIPGTGFVELARAAFMAAAGGAVGAVELTGVAFLAPFQVGAEAPRRLQIDVVGDGAAATIRLLSPAGEVTHMTADARSTAPAGVARVDLAAVRARCARPVATRDGFLDQDFVRFGPRWRNLTEVRFGDGEAVLDLRLDAAFAADLPTLAYHPALFDMATGAAQALIPGFRPAADFLVPFGYDRIRILRPVPAQVVSHVRLRAGAGRELAAFDVTVCDPAGEVVVAIEGFTMKRVDRSTAIALPAAAVVTDGAPGAARHNAAMAALLREAIATDEGLAAFDRVMAQQEVVQVVASSVDVEVWQRKLAREHGRSSGDGGDGGAGFARPALSSDFEAPAVGLEAEVAAIWSKLLGVTDVGSKDDFFELGGNSLLAVRFFARIKKDYGVTMPLSSLFSAPTVRQLAVALQELGAAALTAAPAAAQGSAPAVAAAPVPAAAADPDRVLPPLPIRPGKGGAPVFFVHDGLGEVLLYRSLALQLDARHPVFGLEPETHRGRFVHTDIEAMARAKLARVRTVQPHGPYLLCGLCAGGVVAFEMARQLQELGEQTAFVGMIDAAAVGAEERRFREARQRWDRFRGAFRPAPGQTRLQHVAALVPSLAGKVANLLSYKVRRRLDRARVKQKVAAEPQAGVAAAELTFLQVYEHAHRTHVPGGRFRGDGVVLFRAQQGNGAPDDVPFREIYADDDLGWQAHLDGTLAIVDVPGGHSSVLQEPNVAVLARLVQARLDAAGPA